MARAVIDRWTERTAQPFVLYFHSWELDPDLPRITAANPLARVRQYRNLDKMLARVEDHLRRHRFGSIADHLGLAPEPGPGPAAPPRPVAALTGPPPPPAAPRTPVSVVVPCYNEELVLPYLANTLEEVKRSLDGYELRFVFVDDGSTDGTAAALRRIFGGRPDSAILLKPRNDGVAGAILTGIEAATTEIVCSIDCDCTYDPHQLADLIPLLTGGVDLVTASPYHRRAPCATCPAGGSSSRGASHASTAWSWRRTWPPTPAASASTGGAPSSGSRSASPASSAWRRWSGCSRCAARASWSARPCSRSACSGGRR